jgi:predicted RNase H-like nuclease (RuvC/YqgF family)
MNEGVKWDEIRKKKSDFERLLYAKNYIKELRIENMNLRDEIEYLDKQGINRELKDKYSKLENQYETLKGNVEKTAVYKAKIKGLKVEIEAMDSANTRLEKKLFSKSNELDRLKSLKGKRNLKNKSQHGRME